MRLGLSRFRTISARTRILGLTMFVVVVALGASVALFRFVIIRDQRASNDRRLVQEADEFAELIAVDRPLAAEPSGEYARRILARYLSTNVPDGDEAFLAIVGGVPILSSSDAPAALDDPAWLQRVALSSVSRIEAANTAAGDARVLNLPLVADGQVIGQFAVAVWEAESLERIDRAVRVAAAISAAVTLAALAVAWSTAGRVLRPLRALADTSRRISDSDLSERIPEGGRDEIGSLIVTFNDMLDRLQRSFSMQRSFLDDVGHELRTPLTIVRGHTEIATRPESWEASRPLILGELDRMARIVDDLLGLARSEQPGFVNVRPTDLEDVVAQALQRARTLGERDFRHDGCPALVVSIDPQRIDQALLNLVANAIRHTRPDGVVAIGAAVEGRHVRIWVRDDGVGIAPEAQERIFQRHGGAGPHGPTGAAGLGLSIVAAVAAAHGGSVTVASSVGHGATFSLLLPTGPTE